MSASLFGLLISDQTSNSSWLMSDVFGILTSQSLNFLFLLFFLLTVLSALAANDFLGIVPSPALAVALLIRLTASFVIGVFFWLIIHSPFKYLFCLPAFEHFTEKHWGQTGTTMEKENISAKQLELKTWLERIGLSQNEFAALFFEDAYEDVTEEEIKKFQETFKKQIARKSTSCDRIQTYINFLFTLEKFKEAGYIRPQCHTEDLLDPSVSRMMKKISKKLTEKCELQQSNKLDVEL